MSANKLTKLSLVVAIAITGTFEGYRTVAYQDIGGVWTACFGETLGIKKGDSFTDEQCKAMLANSLNKHNIPLEEIPQQLPLGVHIATLDFAYNVGVGNLRRSALYRYLKNGDYDAACGEFPRWRYAAKRDCSIRSNNCYGVYTRRLIEQDLCRGELSVEQAMIKLKAIPLDSEILKELSHATQ
ncbi:lysozyme [Photobacterium damselae subsp. damselae]|uniref:Lysozyme n=1 Tax=Photobacterium damselae subsp. damselae TaxID=85581 RepID=A0AAD3WW48_PHODD|nr:lysozyme [Photobacterium damselae]KAB1181442.1 lysozyme [Photobacterium damselae subsp. damselae]QSH59301.1 lysozyme [Photobacterium damselae subsp. damselae]